MPDTNKMEEPLFLVECLYCRSSIYGVGSVLLPWCERKRLEEIRGEISGSLRIDGEIGLDTLEIRHGQSSPSVEGLRNIRVISNPTGNPVTLERSDTVIHLPVESASEILWLRDTYNGPDDCYFYTDRSFKIEPKDAVLLADVVILHDMRYRIGKVDRPYVVHPFPESHKNPENMMVCETCMKAMGNPSAEKLRRCIVFPSFFQL